MHVDNPAYQAAQMNRDAAAERRRRVGIMQIETEGRDEMLQALSAEADTALRDANALTRLANEQMHKFYELMDRIGRRKLEILTNLLEANP